MCVETEAPSPCLELGSSLKRHASFVFLHGHDGMRVGVSMEVVVLVLVLGL